MGEIIRKESRGKFCGWYVRYVDSDGKRKCKASKQPTKALAQIFLNTLEARVRLGQVGVIEPTAAEHKKKTITVAELAGRFLEEYDRPKLRNRRHYLAQAGSFVNSRLKAHPLAAMPAAEVRKGDVIRYRDALRAEGYAPGTINDALKRLSLLFAWATEFEYIDGKNPVSHVERMLAPGSEDRYTREQAQRLLALGDVMVSTALYAGLRKGELFGLKWECVRFDRGIIEVKHSFLGPPKNGKSRVVPLHPELAPLLADWQAKCPKTPEGVVFPVAARGRYRMGQENDMQNLRTLLAAADCPTNFPRAWHALRHTFASLLAESHGARDAIEQILGHSASGNKITAGYIHLEVEYLARELAKLTLKATEPAQVLRIADYRQHAS